MCVYVCVCVCVRVHVLESVIIVNAGPAMRGCEQNGVHVNS